MFVLEKQRQRAPSARSLQTRARILDAAEQLFAARGFEGASIRDIARAAGVQGGLVAHHGGSKEELFHLVVSRRAGELSRIRIEALETARGRGPLDLACILDCFIRPYVTLAQEGGPQWVAYGRLLAHVSADPRWSALAAECFDPTAQRFIAEIAALYPDAAPGQAAMGQIYAVSAMLAHVYSAWRLDTLSPGAEEAGADQLIAFATAGIHAVMSGRAPEK
ncbi:TetR family transcriptional regulator [Ruegeria pomeroyi]|uniref:Transcriptional regulator, TetR family n=2 Tax=Ruegeria pomeroyi TaxID=89184 RepID=Q5LVA3_RUEPO|nr:TetR/AcrR family transcriptional regulator [Ruegeria pomeroyi]HCE71723.1 TetR/AcrR family transcriptional regulator [Ruegeria sp.]AAV94104.1 transcriptional regulator, TetR family [Ruegeria pomeroyi DSS-3]NVK98772.1 TetR/AcrR family transcriptional regulator [Ruegeria pomeroyi]NVL00715.1 TetR/AcrR family transcriptional regulator [Ruegeria pomeroyi]QWV07688.1 TetR family transcriptional regulator [Ruegeria pomeroyi]